MIECQCVAELRQVNVVNGQYEPYDHTGHKLTTCTKVREKACVNEWKMTKTLRGRSCRQLTMSRLAQVKVNLTKRWKAKDGPGGEPVLEWTDA